MDLYRQGKWIGAAAALVAFSYVTATWLDSFPLIGTLLKWRWLFAITFGVTLSLAVAIRLLLRFWPSWYRRTAAGILAFTTLNEGGRLLPLLIRFFDEDLSEIVFEAIGPASTGRFLVGLFSEGRGAFAAAGGHVLAVLVPMRSNIASCSSRLMSW